eukprot:4075842-Pyramimonas_sp.AAC.1
MLVRTLRLERPDATLACTDEHANSQLLRVNPPPQGVNSPSHFLGGAGTEAGTYARARACRRLLRCGPLPAVRSLHLQGSNGPPPPEDSSSRVTDERGRGAAPAGRRGRQHLDAATTAGQQLDNIWTTSGQRLDNIWT